MGSVPARFGSTAQGDVPLALEERGIRGRHRDKASGGQQTGFESGTQGFTALSWHR